MSTRAKKRGTAVEVKVRDYLREALDQPGIDRQPLRGSRDEGDLRGLVARGFDCVVEVKAKRDLTRSLVAEYRRQTLAERENAGAGVGVLVTWRYNHPAAEAVAHVTLRDLARLSRPLRVNDGYMGEADGSWVSMTLAELCALIDEQEEDMADERIIDVEPEVIDAPATLTEADRWLAEQRERVEARARDFQAFDIETPEQYRDAKAQRKALRALIAEVDGDKKRMTKQLRDTLNRFNGEVSGILAGLTETDMQYRSEIERWERQVVLERDARIEERYRDEYPDLAAQVPYQRLRERFGADWKADNYGTKESAIWLKVEAAVKDVLDGLETVGAQTHVGGVELTEEDRTDLVAEYLRTLDMAAALRMTQQRVEQREALRRAEEERRAWEAEQAAAQAAIEYDAAQAAPEPVSAPQGAAPEPTSTAAEGAPQTGAQGRETVYVYEVRVPESVKAQFVIEMKRLGTHGQLIGKE